MTKYRIEIDHARRLNRLTVLDALDAPGLKDMMGALWKSAGFDAAYATLFDLTRASLHPLDFKSLRAFLLWILANDPRRGSIGVALGSGEVNEAFGKMVDALRHFASVAEAERWIEGARAASGR